MSGQNPEFHVFTKAEIAEAERASAEAAEVAPHAEVDSTRFFYHCEHRASNTPCPIHQQHMFDVGFDAKGEVTLVVKPEFVKPDNWMDDYASGDTPGIHDEVAVAAPVVPEEE